MMFIMLPIRFLGETKFVKSVCYVVTALTSTWIFGTGVLRTVWHKRML